MPWSFPALSDLPSAETIVPAHLDTSPAVPEVAQGFRFPTPISGPRRGRPPGTFGTNAVRQQIREAQAQQALAITPLMQGREELAQRYRDEARQRAEQALRLPGGISRNALTPSAVPVIGHAILSTLTRAPSKRTSENSTSLRLLALMGGFGRVAGLTRAGELLMLRQHIKAKGPQVRQDNRKLAIASLIWNSSHLIWLSFLSWLLVQLQRKSVKGILFMSDVEFDESSSNFGNCRVE